MFGMRNMKADVLLNEVVVHRLYGEGVVEKAVENRIEVVFENTKRCIFIVPSCFDKFLKLKGEDKQAMIDEELLKWKEENGVFKKEELLKKMQDRQEGINQRGAEREKRKIEKAIEDAKRIRFFAGLDAPDKKKNEEKK